LKSDQLLLKDVYSLLEAAEAEFNDGGDVEKALGLAKDAARGIKDPHLFFRGMVALCKTRISFRY